MPSKCRGCGRPIEWALTSNGKRIPIDVEPVEDGNVTLREQNGRRVAAVGMGGDRQSHFVSCPEADRFRQ